VGITILFWLTPILYPATLIETHGALWIRNIIMYFNPFYYIVELSRYAVIGGSDISWREIGVMSVLATLVLAMGLFVFRKLQPGFADVV